MDNVINLDNFMDEIGMSTTDTKKAHSTAMFAFKVASLIMSLGVIGYLLYKAPLIEALVACASIIGLVLIIAACTGYMPWKYAEGFANLTHRGSAAFRRGIDAASAYLKNAKAEREES